ncbi:MAG: preprotein translocase subunit YajC [Clostridiales bacterium]|nr:preprotein translocase subunit YajC [Clostridiales bacterium]
MNSLSTILSSSSSQASGGSSVMFIVVYIAIFAAIIYFMMIRPQKKQKAKTDQMHQQMEPGDNIMTTSGFYGTILDVVDDTTIIVEFGNNKNCRIPMHKNAVAELEKQGSAVASDSDKDKEKK